MGILQDCYDAREFNKLKLLLGLGHDPNELNELIIKNVCKYAVPLQKEDIQLIEVISEYGHNFTDGDNNNLLHCVCKRYSTLEENIPLAQVLIKNGVDANAVNNDGQTPLFEAATKPSKAITEVLIANGADINFKDKEGCTPLFRAVWANATEVTELLIKKGANIHERDKKGKTPLFSAATGNATKTAQILLVKGADINARDYAGNTPLFSAARSSFYTLNIIKFLEEKGADINARNNTGQTALFAATKKISEEVAKYLIKKGLDVNARDLQGRTPLFMAVKNNSMDVILLFIRYGADVNAKNNDGHTPIWSTKPKIAKLLIEKGADNYVQKKERKTKKRWFKYAVSISRELAELLLDQHEVENLNEFKQVYRILRESGDKIDVNSALFASVSGNFTEFVEILISKGADVNAKNKDFQTPLFKAAHYKVVEILIAKGADINARDNMGETPLFAAAKQYSKDVAEILIANGADVNAKNNDGRTPLFWANNLNARLFNKRR